MPLNRALIGREYPAPEAYEVSREKIRDFAAAIGDANPAYTDVEAAQALGHPDVIAPPTFLTVLAFRFGLSGPVADPELGLDYTMVVHGAQEFRAHRPVRAGDVLDSVVTISDLKDSGRNEVMVTTTEVTAGGTKVATVIQTIVSRGTAATRES